MPELSWQGGQDVVAHRLDVPDREPKRRRSFATDREHIGDTISVPLNTVAFL